MDTPLKLVPLDVRRRAAQHLESLRDTELKESLDLSIGDSVVPIYRPDSDEIAYYEFRLVRGAHCRKVLVTRCFEAGAAKKGRKAGADDAQGERQSNVTPVGFIVASAGRHDFPVTHWSLDRLPPSLQVVADDSPCHCDDGAKDKASGTPARLYKLDTLAYVAEDAKGQVVGASGQRPALLVGLPHSLRKHAGRITSSVAQPGRRSENDETAERSEHDYERKGDSTEVKFETQGDWESYKKRYADAFGPMLEALRERAARVWEIEDAIAKFGEGIVTGTRHRVALLDEASIEVHGEGAHLVRAALEENPSGPPSLVIHALPEPVKQEVDLTVSVKYGNGEHERLQFFIVSRDTPTNARDGKSGPCECED